MANNLRHLRDGRGWSQEQAAAALKTTRSQYVKLEQGIRRLSEKWIARAADAYGIDAGDVVTDVRRGPVPIVGYVSAGSKVKFFAAGQASSGKVDAPMGSSEGTIALEIRGNSFGSLFNGWLVLFDGARSPVTDHLIGRPCVVGLLDGRVLVKRLMRSQGSPALFHLFSQCGDPILDVEVAWASSISCILSTLG